MLCAAAICCQSTRVLPLWVALTAPGSTAGWMEKRFPTLRKSGFGQADPDREKKFLLPLRIAEKLRIRSVLRKLLVTQDAEPGGSKPPTDK